MNVPELAENDPVIDRFPVTFREAAVLTEPGIVRFSIDIPVPAIVVEAPVITSVPPAACEKLPDPVVARLPLSVMVLFARTMDDAANVRLLKFWPPAPLTFAAVPLKITVPVFPLKVPLLIQLPDIVWVNDPPLKVVDAPILTVPPTLTAAAAVNETDVPALIKLLKLPAIVKAVAGNVLTAAPELLLSFKLP